LPPTTAAPGRLPAMSENPVQIRYSDDGGYIYVSINPREVAKHRLSHEDVLEALIETGFSSFEYQLEQDVLEELIRLPWNRLNRVIIRRIAYRVEFDIKVHISQDRMFASLSLIPAYSQEKVSRERLLARLSHSGVKRGLIESAIEQVLSAGEAQMLEIARGQMPEHGRDSWLEVLCPPLELDGITLVEPGTPLVRKHNPAPGVDGYKVSGQVLPARGGQVVNFNPGEGCDLDPQDPSLLVASIEGLAVFSGHYIRVDPLLEVKAEAIQPFYLHSVLIRGELPADVQIHSAGHLIIDGPVTGGELIAGGDLILKQPVTGPVWLQSSGDMHLDSANQALIHCGRNLRLAGSMSHCQSFVAGMVQAADGSLSGGALHSLNSAVFGELGNELGDRTQLYLGPALYFQERLYSLQTGSLDLRRQLEELLRQLIRKRSQEGNTPETEAMAIRQKALLYKDLSQKSEMEVLIRVLDSEIQLEAVVLKALYPPVRLQTGEDQLDVGSFKQAVRLRYQPGQPLVLEPLEAHSSSPTLPG
jgi:uncharacterized protein (DUF342 family)